jgi:coenzyme F420 biosynthesis associated uncharacterized protein
VSVLLDRALALTVARRATGSEPSTTPDDRAAIGRSIREACARADDAVRAFTGWGDAPPVPVAEIIDRASWVEANLAAIEPLMERAAEVFKPSSFARPVLRVSTSLQLGFLFGYLSRKVIGQYDLFGSGRLLFVGPNVVEVERRARVDPADFRLWVALHEVTHGLQAGGVPWLRPAISGFVDRSLSVMRRGPSPARVVGAVRDAVTQGRSLAETILTPEQRELFREAQGLMSVVEGHASFVMDRVGATFIDDVAGLRRAVEGARGRALGPERAMQSVIGLDAKRRQYQDGQSFFDAITDARGMDAMNPVWESPGHVPTVDELADPDAWCRRVLDAGTS